MTTPKTMKALLLDQYHSDLETAINALRFADVPVPKPASGQVLVKVEAAPCNPSDLLFLQGQYGVSKTLPACPGWEGAGTVVENGGGVMGYWLQGKRVACAIQADRGGTWAEYAVADASGCIPLDDDVSYEQGACLIVNPLTAIGLVETAKNTGAKSIIQTAAAGQLGRMVLCLAKQEGIDVINIVRRQEQVDLLTSLGATHVLDSSQEDWQEDLKNLAQQLEAVVAFDAVGGALTGQVLSAMPKESTLLVYGALAGQACSGITPFDLIFQQKQVQGFWLSKWIQSKGLLGMMKASGDVQKLMKSGSIHTQIAHTTGLEKAANALREYHRKMTAGKIVIFPSHESKN